jgi:hypothetical protein
LQESSPHKQPATGPIERRIACPRALTIWRWSRNCAFCALLPLCVTAFTNAYSPHEGVFFPAMFLWLCLSAPTLACMLFLSEITHHPSKEIYEYVILISCHIFQWFAIWWHGLLEMRNTDRDYRRFFKILVYPAVMLAGAATFILVFAYFIRLIEAIR